MRDVLRETMFAPTVVGSPVENSASTTLDSPHGTVEVSRDPVSGEVHALRGPRFAGVQFHPESVLTEHGVDLLRKITTPLVRVHVP